MTLKHALQTMTRLDPLLDESEAQGDQCASFTHRLWRNPDGWDEVGSEQASELDCITRIGLDACGADQFHRKADEPP
jgi:hypothetical protein